MSGRHRQTVAIWAGAGIALVVVAAVLLTTLSSGGNGGPASSTVSPQAGVGETSPFGSDEAAALFAELAIPDGDYGAYCEAADGQGEGVDTDDSLAMLRAVIDSDLEALIAVAPEGLVPALQRIRDGGAVVTKVLDQVSSISELTPADLPEDFLRDFGVVMRATLVNCYGVSLPS